MKTRVLNRLKTKASSFGFNREEMMSIAEIISGNQTLTDESSDEDIDASINAVIPLLGLSQKFATRLVNASKTNQDPSDGGTPPAIDPKPNDNEPEWAKAMTAMAANMEAMAKRLATYEQESSRAKRTQHLSEVLKDTGAYGKSILNSVERMNFKDDADFESWLDGVKEEAKAFKQDESNNALGRNAKPQGGNVTPDVKVATDEQLQALVASV